MVKSVENQGKGGVYMLSLSDWIAFLTSEKNSNVSNIISFAALFLAAFAIIKTVTSNSVVGAVVLAVIAIALTFIYLRTIGRYGRRAREAGKLLDDIMSGKERDPSKIEKRWIDLSEKGNAKNK
jgi:Flp pilus assembly protein TadB